VFLEREAHRRRGMKDMANNNCTIYKKDGSFEKSTIEEVEKKDKILKDTNNLAVRFVLRSEADKVALEEFQTLLIINGIEFAEWFGKVIKESGKHLRQDSRKINFVDGEYLQNYVREKFGKELTRFQLNDLRNRWTEKVQYYSAPKGNMREFRYNFDKCLEDLNKFGEK